MESLLQNAGIIIGLFGAGYLFFKMKSYVDTRKIRIRHAKADEEIKKYKEEIKDGILKARKSRKKYEDAKRKFYEKYNSNPRNK